MPGIGERSGSCSGGSVAVPGLWVPFRSIGGRRADVKSAKGRFDGADLVGAPRFELGTPSPPGCYARDAFARPCNNLAHFAHGGAGVCVGLGDLLLGVGDLIIEHMRVFHRGLDVGVIEYPLRDLDVAGLPQHLRTQIVPIVVKSEANHSSALAQASPFDLDAGIGEGTALALDPAVAGPLRLIGEDHLGVMPAQRPEDIPDRRDDPHRFHFAALTGLYDLARVPVDVIPRQGNTLPQSQARRRCEGEERCIIFAHRGIEPLRFVRVKLAHPLLRLGQPEPPPLGLALAPNSPGLSAGEQFL